MRLPRTVVGIVAAIMFSVAVPAAAIEPPPPVPADSAPPDGTPAPESTTQQKKFCQNASVLPNTDITVPVPSAAALNLSQARALSQGAGVTVAVLDSGAAPQPRLPNLVGGGDYVSAGGDGLSDCDAHGTLVAGVIGGAPDPKDAFEGVAPQAKILSIRVWSAAFEEQLPQNSTEADKLSLQIRTTARAIVHAANQGAQVILVSTPVCIPGNLVPSVDQSLLASAVGYAVRVRDAVVVAASGEAGGSGGGGGGGGGGGCKQNPDVGSVAQMREQGKIRDPRNWSGVVSVETPDWFTPDVLTVGATNATGSELGESEAGPWVSVAAPGTAIESLGPAGGVVNGIGTEQVSPASGSAYSAAYVAGVAALLRSRFPNETPLEIDARLQASAHSPAEGVDNFVGAGFIDPVTALSYRSPPGRPEQLLQLPLSVPPPKKEDHRPGIVAGAVIFGAVLLGVAVLAGGRIAERRL